jgi:hypothetical protein
MFLICECKDMKKIRDGKIYCVKNTQRAEFFFSDGEKADGGSYSSLT